jgi:hypothetical protein
MASKRFKCPICEFSCGRAKPFEDHLIKEHGFSSTQDAYVKLRLGGVTPKCACKSCDQIPHFKGWNRGFAKYIDGHSGKIYSAFGEEKAKEIAEARASKLRGRKGWSKGLTKETSTALSQAAKARSKTLLSMHASGTLRSWSKGLTKETDERVAAQSRALKEQFSLGAISPWSKGLTKETDERVLQMSRSVSMSHRKKELRGRLDAIKRLDPKVIKQRLQAHVEQLELITDLSNYTRDRHVNLDFRCRKCGNIQKKSLIQALSDRCDYCTPIGSKGQRELYEFSLTLDPTALANDRTIITPQELGVTLPQFNVCLEFNGLYFHSEIFKSKRYHNEKSIEAAEAGWRLIHIWEDEWREKRAIVESIIRHRCGLSKVKTAARKCDIIQLSAQQRKEFFEANHIDGDVRASSAWGLYDTSREKVVAAISVRKPMHKKWKGALEVARFATITNESIPGAVGRLHKVVEQHAQSAGFGSVMTYVDSRFGSIFAAGYEKVGFTLARQTPPRFWWTDGYNRIDRFKVRADKEQNLTEKQVADSLGVVKIWGCQNLLYTKQILTPLSPNI